MSVSPFRIVISLWELFSGVSAQRPERPSIDDDQIIPALAFMTLGLV
jgi:hypothetical protein